MRNPAPPLGKNVPVQVEADGGTYFFRNSNESQALVEQKAFNCVNREMQTRSNQVHITTDSLNRTDQGINADKRPTAA